MPAPTTPRDFALDIVRKLRGAGYEALWAGGCVRDQLLGQVPKDYDVATSATPDQIRDVFGRRRTLPIGAAFGVVTVLGPRSAGQIEVATFRTDAAYSDGRHPDSVTFTTAEHDAMRRDFTINGLFYDPVAEVVVDYVGGQQDLQGRVVRAIGDPHLRLREDKLRMLRAVRFAAAFEFTIDPFTFGAIQQMAGEVTNVSAERIGTEVRRMLLDAHRVVALRLLRESNLLSHVLPEIATLPADAWQRTLERLARLRDPTLPLVIAALLYDVETATLESVPLLPAPSPQPPARAVGRRLKYTNKEIERAAWLLGQLPAVSEAPQLAWPRLQRVLVHDGAAELVALQEAVASADDPALAFCRERLAWPANRLNPIPLVDGAALIRHGLKPGPSFTTILDEVRNAQLNGEIRSREEALALVDRLL